MTRHPDLRWPRSRYGPVPGAACGALLATLALFAVAAKAAEASDFLGGHVADTAGRPVASARVLVASEDGTSVAAEAETDAHGDFCVEADERAQALVVAARGFEGQLIPEARVADSPLSITLRPEARLEGRIVESGTLVAVKGARVELTRHPGRFALLPPALAERVAVPTVDATTGAWELGGLAPAVYDVRVAAPGHRSLVYWDVTLTPGDVLRLDTILAPSAALEVTVKDAGGSAVGSATVTLRYLCSWQQIAERPCERVFPDRRMSAAAGVDPAGQHTFDELVPGQEVAVRASAPGHAEVLARATLGAAGETARLGVALGAGAHVAGRVVEQQGAPVPDALVALRRARDAKEALAEMEVTPESVFAVVDLARAEPGSDWWARSAKAADTEGRFDLSDVPAGAYDVLVQSEEADREVKDPTIHVAEGEERLDLRVVVELDHRLQGLVVDRDGKPVPGARVEICSERSEYMYGRWFADASVTTDARGRFVARGTGERCAIRVTADGGLEATLRKVPTDATDLRVVLERVVRGAIVGRATVGTGEPVAKLMVELTRSSGAPVAGERDALHYDIETRDGWYRLDGVEPDTWTVTFQAPGCVPRTVKGVRVDASSPRELQVTLDRGESLAGFVVSRADGAPVAEAQIALALEDRVEELLDWHPERGLVIIGKSDLDGHFRLEGVPPGSHTLVVQHPRFASERVPCVVAMSAEGAEPVNVRLGTGGAIEGRFTESGGTPVARGQLRVLSEDALLDELHETDKRGHFRAERLPAGTYRLEASPRGALELEGGVTLTLTAVVKEGETVTADFVAGGGRLHGRLLRGEAPVAGAYLAIGSPEDVPGASSGDGSTTTTATDGAYALEGLEPGPYRVRVFERDSGRRESLLDVEVREGDTERDLLLPTLTVRGRVVEEGTNDGLEEVVVRAFRPGERSPWGAAPGAHTGKDGSFEIALPAPGAWELRARAYLHPRALALIEVPETGLEGVRIELGSGVVRTGRVVSQRGEPVAHARVNSPDTPTGGDTDDEGRFRITLPSDRAADLFVMGRGYALSIIRGVPVSDEELVVVLGGGGSLAIQVEAAETARSKAVLGLLDSRGDDILPLYALYGPPQDDVQGDFARAGRVTMQRVTPGDYRVVVRSKGQVQATAAVTVAAGETARVVLRF